MGGGRACGFITLWLQACRCVAPLATAFRSCCTRQATPQLTCVVVAFCGAPSGRYSLDREALLADEADELATDERRHMLEVSTGPTTGARIICRQPLPATLVGQMLILCSTRPCEFLLLLLLVCLLLVFGFWLRWSDARRCFLFSCSTGGADSFLRSK